MSAGYSSVAEERSSIVASARLPGAVLGEVDDGKVNYVSGQNALERGAVAGFYSEGQGDARLLRPRLSKAAYDQLVVSRLPEVPGYLEGLLGQMTRLSSEGRLAYLRSRKAVEQTMGNGQKRVIIVPRVPDAKDEVELVDMELSVDPHLEVVAGVTAEELGQRRKKKTYTLLQVLNDTHVTDKYPLGQRMLETAKRLVLTDPVKAANALQDAMNSIQDQVNVRVTAGEYAKGKAQARAVLAAFCSGYRALSASVRADVIGDELFMHGPPGQDDWFVSGPLKYAAEVSYVYWVLWVDGLIIPNKLLSMEFVVLGINVYDGESYAEPTLVFHAALPGEHEVPPPTGLSERTTALLSYEQRAELEALGDRLLPVMGSGGDQMATAVRVTDRHVLVNSHVLDADPLCTVAGLPVRPQVQLSRDLWSVDLLGSAQPWNMRDAMVGERAVIVYKAAGKVSCSPPLNVLSVDRECVVVTMDEEVVAGISGGALVSLSDFFLLGVHSASTMTSLVSFKFGPAQFSALLDVGQESVFSRESEEATFAAKTYERFKKNGLGHVFEVVLKSLIPVFVGPEQVGMAVYNGNFLYTTCDAENKLCFGAAREPYVMETVVQHQVYRTKLEGAVGPTPVYRRRANPYEKVFVVGFDTEAYLSCESTVSHVRPDGKSFVVDDIPSADKPMTGGLVVARDGAVLGMCGTRSCVNFGALGYVCWPLPVLGVVSKLDVRSVLAKKFPFLNLQAWSDSLLEEVFTHSSCGRYSDGRPFNVGAKPLANIGDNAAKMRLYMELRDMHVPHNTWNMIMQETQSNAAFAKVAWSVGLAECLKTGLGATFAKDNRAYADLTEAFLGAAAMTERRPVFRELCRVMGLLPVPVTPAVVDEEASNAFDDFLRDRNVAVPRAVTN